MIITTLLIPLLILLLPLFFVIKVGKTPRKVTHWLLLVYIGILILATLSVPFITKSDQALERVDSERDDWWELTWQLRNGQLESPLAQQYLVKQSTLDLEQKKTLQLNSERSDSNVNIFIEKKEKNDDQLEVFIFQGELTLSGYDFSSKLEPLHFYLRDHLTGKVLTIAPQNQHIQVSFTLPEFTTRQFTGGDTWMSDRRHGSGSQTIYLRVPHDLEVIADEELQPYLDYVQS